MVRPNAISTQSIGQTEAHGSERRMPTVWNGTRETAIVVALSGVFFLFYLTIFTVDRQIFAREIIFYNALNVLWLTGCILIVLWLVGALRRVSNRAMPARIPLAILLFLFMGYSFAITVPALINRSISLFMISQVVESGAEGITREELQDKFISQYVIDNGAIPRRLSEQVVTGNFLLRGNHYVATDGGKLTFRIYKAFLRAFKTSEDYRKIKPTE